MRLFKTKSAQIKELKYQLGMKKYITYFNEFNIHFSKNSSSLTITVLVQMLENIIKSIASKPAYPLVLEMLSMKELSVLSNAISNIAVYEKSIEDFKKEIKEKIL